MAETKAEVMLETKLKRIALRSQEEADLKFDKLMPLFNSTNLIQCFHELKTDRAMGVDRQSKEDYGSNLKNNIENLIARMKIMAYRPLPVREVLIPKDNGGARPLGISGVEDKIIQLMYSKILESIFEPHFLNCSYGFRPGRNCHQAVQAVDEYLFRHWEAHVIDADMENYFGTIEHGRLIEILRTRVNDEVFLRYLVRMLKSGILRKGCFFRTDEGSPQGAICSPVLSNIYAHEVLDVWLRQKIAEERLDVRYVRYADDFVICCPHASLANRILRELDMRLRQYGLRLNWEKTTIVELNKNAYRDGRKQGTFSFLGFMFYLARSRNGRVINKIKTDPKRFRSKLRKVKSWVRARRSKDFNDTWLIMTKKLQGHVYYYGVSHNTRQVSRFVHLAHGLFFKWMNRRSQKCSMTWEQFDLYRSIAPRVNIKVYHLFHQAAR